VALALLAVITTALPASAWTLPRVLDGDGGANGRVRKSVGRDAASVRYRGEVHAFYAVYVGRYPDGGFRLRHAVLSGPATFETLDGAGGGAGRTTDSVGPDVSAAVFAGVLHVFYQDGTTNDLRHGWFDGERWRFEVLDGDSTDGGRLDADVGWSSTATVYDGRLEVFSLDHTNTDIRRATFDGVTWSFQTLDGDSVDDGHTPHEVGYNVTTVQWGGDLHVLYYERDPAYGALLGWLRDATYDGSSWTYGRAFRTSDIYEGDVLAAAAVSPTEVYVVTGALGDADAYFLWRRWDGATWTETKVLTSINSGESTTPSAAAVVDGLPMVALFGAYFTWHDGVPTGEPADSVAGYPEPTYALSAVVMPKGGVKVFWWGNTGIGGPALLVTSGP
jgi:hypothetical protein